MFRASTILRELVQNLAKVTLLLKHSVKLIRCILCDVAACREMACVLFVVQTAVCSTTNTCDFLKFIIPLRGGNESTRAVCQKCSHAAS
jgi:hypothetical protein